MKRDLLCEIKTVEETATKCFQIVSFLRFRGVIKVLYVLGHGISFIITEKILSFSTEWTLPQKRAECVRI